MCCSKAKCLKFFIFSTNVVFFVVGIGLLTAVSKAVTDVDVFTHFIKIDMALRLVFILYRIDLFHWFLVRGNGSSKT